MQIESENYTWTLIYEMYQMDRSVNQSFSNNIQESPELLHSEMIEASKNFMDIIGGVLESAYSTKQTDDHDITTLTDCFFIWNLIHIFYIDKNNSIAEDFSSLVSKSFPPAEKLEDFLIRADFGGFLTNLKTYGSKYINNDPVEKQRLVGVINTIQELVINRNNFFKPIDIYETRAIQKNTFSKSFETQKDHFKDVLITLQTFSNHNDPGISSLINSVKLLAGDIEFIKQEYYTSDMQLFSAYMLFIDPLLEKKTVCKFLSSINIINKSKININNEALEQKSLSQSKDDSLLSINDLPDEDIPDDILLQNCPDLLKLIIAKLFLHPTDAYYVAEIILESSPKWFSFHIIKLLVIIGKIKHSAVDADEQSDYYHMILDGYLKYLIIENSTFNVFKSYYLQMYDFDIKIKFDYLIRIIFININDNEMLSYLSKHKAISLIEKTITHFINSEKCQTLENTTIVSLLAYVKDAYVAGQLYEILFAVKLNKLRLRSNEEYIKELEILISHTFECLEHEPTELIWRVKLLNDVLKYKLQVLKKENLDASFINQLLEDFSKSIEIDPVISFELIDCIKEILKSTQNDISTFLEYEVLNDFIRNLEFCRIKQDALKKPEHYSILLYETEDIAMKAIYGG